MKIIENIGRYVAKPGTAVEVRDRGLEANSTMFAAKAADNCAKA